MTKYIGLMSGTSMDGVDAVLVDIQGNQLHTLAATSLPYSDALLATLHQLCEPRPDEINIMGEAERAVAFCFARCVKQLLLENELSPEDIRAIGSHGQTIRHYPEGVVRGSAGFSLQIGDPHTIAIETGIDVVHDFRRKDVALGGQGAPLVPAFHAHQFGDPDENRLIINLGGIANVTYLPAHSGTIVGFDTGPANTLMDAWCRRHLQVNYDQQGMWAASGKVHEALLLALLEHPYLACHYPKSTGREDFNLAWVDTVLAKFPSLKEEDVQATLLAFTAQSIADAVKTLPPIDHYYVCGGGAFNPVLIAALAERLRSPVSSTSELNIHPQWVEGAAFAWLAHAYLQHIPGNVPSVTGAAREAVLGCLTTAK